MARSSNIEMARRLFDQGRDIPFVKMVTNLTLQQMLAEGLIHEPVKIDEITKEETKLGIYRPGIAPIKEKENEEVIADNAGAASADLAGA